MTSLACAALRGLGLAARMVLALYIARVLGLVALASYGFVVGAAGVTTALTGFGLDYAMRRALVVATPVTAISLFRDRLILRVGTTGAIVVGAALVLATMAPGSALLSWSVAFIVLGEPVVTDLQQALVARRRPIAGNAVLFVRAGAWVPIAVVAGLLQPEWRTLGVVFAGWAAAIAAILVAATILSLRAVPARTLDRIDASWLRAARRTARSAYLSDIAFAASIYSDRYLVSWMLGPEAAGVVVFVWSFANGIVPLVQSAVFDRVTPTLIGLRDQPRAAWTAAFAAARRHTLMLSTTLGVLTAAFTIVIAPHAGMHVTIGFCALTIAMVAALVVRLQADILRHGLIALDADRDWARIDLIVLAAAPLVGGVSIWLTGIYGAAVQMAITSVALYLGRRRILTTAASTNAQR
jgi:hypothetical protein